MKTINIIANRNKTENGELLTIENLKAELKECEVLRPKPQQHISSLKAMIKYKLNHPLNEIKNKGME